jgi:hypothetical protein
MAKRYTILLLDASLVGGFLFDPPEAESWVGTASRSDAFWRVAARRGGQEWP